MAGPEGIIDYASHKAGVLGGKYSMNPYALGFKLLMEIEDRWNKGKFGQDYEDCTDMRAKAEWDKGLGLGKQKVFEVRKFYNDYLLIAE
ncbi:SpoVR family protein, partial [Acinetobacter baumannii]